MGASVFSFIEIIAYVLELASVLLRSFIYNPKAKKSCA